MNEMDAEGSWKGRLWLLFYVWPFLVFLYLKDLRRPETTQEIIIAIFMMAATIGWLFMCRKAYLNLKAVFGKKK